jgi:purine nucleoside phosphorylase
MDWSRAKLFDFTGFAKETSQFQRFGDDVIEILRQPTDCKLAIILDTGFGWQSKTPVVVQDHVNLSGYNPLIGPNHPIGERFPVVQGIYTDCAAELALDSVVVAGIKHGRSLSVDDASFLHILGADCYCYNVVPTMLVAAHACWKVLAIVGPDNRSWQGPLLEKIYKMKAKVEESVS